MRVLFFLYGASLLAQTASITGCVADPSESGIPGAKVVVTHAT